MEYAVDFDAPQPAEAPSGGADDESAGQGGDEALYKRALSIVVNERKASISLVQRRLQIGYNRAARLIEMLERDGVISPASHAGKRDVLKGRDDDGEAGSDD